MFGSVICISRKLQTVFVNYNKYSSLSLLLNRPITLLSGSFWGSEVASLSVDTSISGS